MIDGRWCDLKVPDSQDKKDGKTDKSSCKIFVGRVTENLSKEDLRDHFEAFGQVTDVYIPTPFRQFAFVQFSECKVAQSLLGKEHLIKGVSVKIGEAAPKGRDHGGNMRGGRGGGDRFGGDRFGGYDGGYSTGGGGRDGGWGGGNKGGYGGGNGGGGGSNGGGGFSMNWGSGGGYGSSGGPSWGGGQGPSFGAPGPSYGGGASGGGYGSFGGNGGNGGGFGGGNGGGYGGKIRIWMKGRMFTQSCQVAMVEDTGPVEAATGTMEEADNRTEGIKDGLSDQNEKYDYGVYMIMIMIMMSDVLRTHGLI